MRPPTAVYDIETENWTHYVTGAFKYLDTGRTVVTRDSDKLFAELLRIEGDVWAQNGGKYDHLWFLDNCRRKGINAQVSMAGSRVTRVQVGKLCLRDSYALIPMKLEKAATIVGPDLVKGETGLPCICGAVRPDKPEGCGGYCSIKRDMPEGDYVKLERYLVQDCDVLAQILERVWEYSAEHKIQLRGTVGGSAWASAQGELGLPDAAWQTSGDYRMARASYYGGRCEARILEAPEIWRYDIHASYPAALARLKLPVGGYHVVPSDKARREFRLGSPGIYSCSVVIPALDIPPLPVRSGSTGRICWPFGRVSGIWTRHELRYSMSRGVKVEAFGPAIIWESEEAILAPWVKRLWTLRDNAPTPGIAAWLKWLMNSLTGKLGSRPNLDIYAVGKSPRACDGGDHECDGIRHPTRTCCRHRCIGKCRRWDPLDLHGRLWRKKTWRIPSCAHVHWAAYLTSEARIELQKELIHAGADAVYCATDSVYATRPLLRGLGDELGAWGLEGRGTDWHAVAPGAYSYHDPDQGFECKIKGVSEHELESWQKFIAGETLTATRGVKSLKSAARDGEWFTRKTIERSRQGLDGWVGSRLKVGKHTVPVDIAMLPPEIY